MGEGLSGTDRESVDGVLRLLILKQPTGIVAGVSLKNYRPGRVYEVTGYLANYLIVEGFALVEMRQQNRSSRVRPNERRRGPNH